MMSAILHENGFDSIWLNFNLRMLIKVNTKEHTIMHAYSKKSQCLNGTLHIF